MTVQAVPADAPPQAEERHVLVVQEDGDVCCAWTAALRGAGYVPHALESIEGLFEALLDFRQWRAIVVDLGFRGAEATTFLDRLRADNGAIPVLLTAWEGSLGSARAARNYPGLVFIPAPLPAREIALAVHALAVPPKPHKASTDLFIVHKAEGMIRSECERVTLLPEAAQARAEVALAASEEARFSRHELIASGERARSREFQLRLLLETIPQPEGYQIAAKYLPAEHVGGDYYDVLPLPDGRIAMVVADVSGKGIAAAMVMVMARTVFRSIAPGAADARQLVTEAADRIALDLPGGTFVSLACGMLDPASGSVSVVNAGHLPPLHWSMRDGVPFVQTLDARGAAIGLVKGPRFRGTLHDCEVTLQPDEQLVFFTDGVNESMNRKDEEYGDQRLHHAVKQSGGTTAEQMTQGIVNSVLHHRGTAPPSDDMTVLVLKRT